MGHLEGGATDPEDIADVNLVIRHTLDGEVFTEMSIDKVITTKFPLPITKAFEVVDMYGLINSTMYR